MASDFYNTTLLDEAAKQISVYDANTQTILFSVKRKDAVHLVKQGGAHVISSTAVELIFPNSPNNRLLREYVFNRDDNTCVYCGDRGDTIDHVVPVSKHGQDTILNCVCACLDCNQIKADTHPNTFFALLKTGEINIEREKSKIKVKRERRMEKVKAHELRLKYPERFIREKKPQMKTCFMCEKSKEMKHYSQHHEHCDACHPHEIAFLKGYISSSALSSLNTDVKKLVTNAFISVLDKDGNVFNLVAYDDAESWILHHMATVVDKFTVQLLYSRNEMVLLHANKEDLIAI